MKVCAIVAEYNPFHTGHLHHLKTVKQFSDAIVVILTGAITQRGEFSIFSKWTRAKSALLKGANLVLEMPTIFSCSSAEKFAHAAIKIAKELKFITHISFGSEIGEIKKILELAEICKDIDKTEKIKFFLKKGYSYPKARQLAIGKKAELLKFPNNTLGVEYVKAAINLNFKVTFKTTKRIGAAHNSNLKQEIVSSKFIRDNIKNFEKIKKYIPNDLLKLYKNPINIPQNFIFNSLRQATKKDFKNLPDTTEGLYNRLFKISKESTSLKDFFQKTKTKRYTLTRLNRISKYCFFKINKNKIKKLPQYSLVLGFDKTGQKLLSLCKKNENFLFTTNFKKIFSKFPYSATIDSTSTDFISIFLKNPKPCGVNFKTKPIII